MSAILDPADGHAGARRCAALLGIALCSEPTAATLREEGMKVDLKLTFKDPFLKTPSNLFCQVKSGDSYKAASSTKERIRLQNIGEETLGAFRRELGVIVWVPPKPVSEIYWYLCQPDVLPSKVIIDSKMGKVSPAIRYIIARSAAQRRREKAVSIQILPKAGAARQILVTARTCYRQIKTVDSQLFGKICLTRAAWRHITRRSKSVILRNRSLRTVPYLSNVLSACPDSHSVKESRIRREGGRLLETRIIVCWYANALTVDGETCALMARVREEISYPCDWFKFPLSDKDVHYQSTLLSWWVRGENSG